MDCYKRESLLKTKPEQQRGRRGVGNGFGTLVRVRPLVYLQDKIDKTRCSTSERTLLFLFSFHSGELRSNYQKKYDQKNYKASLVYLTVSTGADTVSN